MDRAPDPVAALLSLADAAVRGAPASPAVAAWLAAGVRAYLAGGASLDAALGLSGGPGTWSARTRAAYRSRDAHIRRAFELTGRDVGALAARITVFRGRRWPRWRHLDSPPQGAAPVDVELWGAFKSGVRMPCSPKHLSRIVRRPVGLDFSPPHLDKGP